MPTCTPMKVETRPTHAIAMPQNKSGCIPPRGREIVLDTSNARSREAREATEQPEEYDDLLDSPRIGLKFSGAKTKYGMGPRLRHDLAQEGHQSVPRGSVIRQGESLDCQRVPQSQQYIDNVTRFHQRIADTADLIEFISVRSLPATELPSPTGTRTPSSNSGPILWTKKLGEGSLAHLQC
jgi:hypothetical protein